MNTNRRSTKWLMLGRQKMHIWLDDDDVIIVIVFEKKNNKKDVRWKKAKIKFNGLNNGIW